MSWMPKPFVASEDAADASPALSESQAAELRELHEMFARDLGTALSALTRRRVSAEVEPPEQIRVEDWEQEAAKVRYVIALRVDPPGATALLALDGGAAFGLLEGLLGAGLTPRQGLGAT